MKETNKSKLFIRIALIIILVCAAILITYMVGSIYNTEPTPLDLSVQKFFIDIRSSALSGIVIPLTHVSDTATIIVLCLVLLLLPNRKKYGIPLSCAAIAGVAVYKPMKEIFLRARPDEALHLVIQGGYSYPSGHSTTSVVVFGLLAYLIFKNVEDKTVKRVLGTMCIIFAVTIGLSRLYVGVHWATDVLCGWSVGLAVLLTAITVVEKIEKRG